jgi:putative phosphoesterase
MRIIVITDVHANLPALQAALKAIREGGYDIIVHTGDAIGLGPYPAECLELLFNTPNVRFVMGNHESYFVNGLPKPQPSLMSDGEVRHHLWTHAQLEPGLKTRIAQWAYSLSIENPGTKATFMHYALDASGQDFVRIIRHPVITDMDSAFSSLGPTVVFYGHDHRPSDMQGRLRYVNPGPLGCSREAVATYCSVDLSQRGLTVEHLSIPYDRTGLYQAFEQRSVPERQFIQQAFFGRDA